jgi:catechol 2,3-dioxygenase
MTMSDTRIPSTSIDPATTVGMLSLTVADLERSLAFYTEAIGFQVLRQEAEGAVLGAGGQPLLHLQRCEGARPWPRDTRNGYTGLYHFAILLPTRADLGRWLQNWRRQGFPWPGQGDHLVSEALYLEDPDGNGIEVYRDRPRSEWQWDGDQVRMGSDPVDLAGVLAAAEREGKPWTGLPAGTRLGHMHLQAGNIAQAAAFYHDVLGFDIVARMPTALFVSAGGYHHHIGLNTWHSLNAGPAPVGTAGLRFFTIDLPHEAARQAVLDRLTAAGFPFTQTGDLVTVRDPWQNTIVLRLKSNEDVPFLLAATKA